MTDLTNILLVILLVLGCVVLVYVVLLVRRTITSLETLTKEVADIKEELIPAMRNLSALSEQAKTTLQDLETQKQNLDATINYAKRFTANIVRVQESILERVEPPIQEFGSMLQSLSKGLRSFFAAYRSSTPFDLGKTREEE